MFTLYQRVLWQAIAIAGPVFLMDISSPKCVTMMINGFSDPALPIKVNPIYSFSKKEESRYSFY